jgi:hypothetical protein
MADKKKLKGNKRELNGKVEKVDMTESRSYWIRSDDPALQEKRAKDLRRMRYQTAQGEVAREIRATKERIKLENEAREERHALLLKELAKQKK